MYFCVCANMCVYIYMYYICTSGLIKNYTNLLFLNMISIVKLVPHL